MRKSAVALAALLMLVVLGLSVAPLLVDLDRFKGPIAAELARRTGRGVEIAGRIRLSLLTAPTITAYDLRLANPPGAAVKDMVRLRAADVKLALLPLLSGTVEITGATLIEPEIDVERSGDGTLNWPLPGGSVLGTAGEHAIALPVALAITGVAIQNGAVTWRSDGAIERFEHINASATLSGPSGPFGASGTLVARGAALSFDVQGGRLDGGELPLQVTMTSRPAARLQLDLLLTGADGQRRLAGKVKLAADDLRAVAGTVARLPLPPELAQPLALSGDVGGTLNDLALDHLALDFGPAHGEGRLSVTEGTPLKLGLALSISRLDLDRWPMPRQALLGPLLIGSAEAAPAEPAAVLPVDIDAKLKLGVDAILWRAGILRDAKLELALSGGRISIDRAAALLPVGAQVTLRGDGTIAADGAHAGGVIEAQADDLRAVLRWAGVPATGVPADRLRKASLSSRFSLNGERLDLGPIDASLDATRLGGAATVALRRRPGIGLRLTADRFNLDAYLPGADAPAAAGDADSGVLGSVDANLDAHADTVTWRGQPMLDVHLAGTLQKGELTVRELGVGDVAGASGKVSGVIEGWTGNIPKGQFAFDMRGAEFARLIRLSAPELAAGRSFGAFTVGGGLQSDGATLSLDSDLQLLDGHAHVSGDVTPAVGKLALDFDLDHPNFAALMRALALGYAPAGGEGEALSFSGHLAGDLGGLAVEPLSLTIGASTLEGSIKADLLGRRPLLAADLKLGDWSIDRLLPARAALSGATHSGLLPGVWLAQAGAAPHADAAEPGPLALADLDLTLSADRLAYGAWRIDQPVLSGSIRDGAVKLARLAGNAFGGSIEASGDLDHAAPPKLQAHVTLANADPGQVPGIAAVAGDIDGRLAADATLTASGDAAAAMIAHLGGDVALKSENGSIRGLDLAAANAALAAPGKAGDLAHLVDRNGRTPYTLLDGRFHVENGVARSDDVHLAAEGGEGHATLTLDLAAWTMSSRSEFRLTGVPDAPPLIVHLDGPVAAPRIVFDVNAIEQFLAQRAEAPAAPAPPPAAPSALEGEGRVGGDAR